MAVEIFLVIPPGSANPPITADPVQDQYFKTTFPKAAVVQIRQFSLGTENPTSLGSAATGAAAAENAAAFNPVVMKKSVDTLSSALFSIAVTGNQLTTMQLYIRRAGAGGGKPYLAYQFGSVFVARIDWSAGSGDEEPIEQVTFAYESLALGYYPQKPDGTRDTAVTQSWNQVTNSEAPSDVLADF
jgi:type VI secretion system secreted protein Hcp